MGSLLDWMLASLPWKAQIAVMLILAVIIVSAIILLA
jgi:hypothetical protein